MKKKKVLITGSAGFIFSNFVRLVLKEKLPYELVSIDKVSKPGDLNNIFINNSHKFYLGDITDDHFMDNVFNLERPDFVINGAAESFVDSSIEAAQIFVKSNVLGTQVIIDKCLKYNVKKLLHASTDECYGHLTSEAEPSWTEKLPLNPRNPYSASKASAEFLVQAAHQTHGLNYNITRSCNNFGPRQPPRNLIPKIIKCILSNQPIPIYGNGLQMREWIYVIDNCLALLKVLEGPDNEVFNVSTGNEISNLELTNHICNLIGRGHDLISFVKDRPGHDWRYSIDSSKLRSLGWKPSFKFKDSLQYTVQWYMKNSWILGIK